MTDKQKNYILTLQGKCGGPTGYLDPKFIFGKHPIHFSWTSAKASEAIKILLRRVQK